MGANEAGGRIETSASQPETRLEGICNPSQLSRLPVPMEANGGQWRPMADHDYCNAGAVSQIRETNDMTEGEVRGTEAWLDP